VQLARLCYPWNMPSVDSLVSVDDLRGIYPGEDDTQLQTRLVEALGWVHYYSPCSASDAFAASKAGIAKSVLLRALRYDKMSSEGALQQKQTGPVGITLDTRRPSSSTLFSAEQRTVLQSLCQTTSAGSTQAQPVSVPLTDPTMPYGY
jgi:hypothetical protein